MSKPSKPRGFAGMSKAKVREIASAGGKAAHRMGRAHEFSSEEAQKAGHTGGERVSRDRAHMAKIGRQGGLARGRARTETPTDPAPPPPVSTPGEEPEVQ